MATTSTALKASKKNLRTLMKTILSDVPAESIDTQSAAICESITNLEAYQDAKRIGIYLAMPTGEVETAAIVYDALKNGKEVFVPYLHRVSDSHPGTPRSWMDMVDLHSLSDYTFLKRDSWGIPTVDSDTLEHREHILKHRKGLDLIFMPGVAYQTDESTGYVKRIGHGKGFYDTFLHKYRESQGSHVNEPSKDPGSDVLLYGLALKEQFLDNTGEEVPLGEHDCLLHGLLLGDGRLVEGPAKGA